MLPHLDGNRQAHVSETTLLGDGPQYARRPAEGTLTGAPVDTKCNKITDEENSKMQLWFNSATREAFDIPEGYQQVTVLIIKWKADIDELKTQDEVRRLKKLFRKQFNYKVRVLELNNESKPQIQLSYEILKFVKKFDGPHNLLIFYYTGHGYYRSDTEVLEFHAGNSQTDRLENKYYAMVDWSKAEKPLIEDAEGDAVVIFDACYSSNLMKNTRSGEPRSYELLAAVGHDQATAGPGPKSFTTAMIRSLEELLEECHRRPFTVRQLCERINLRIERRHNPSHVWSRLQCFERNIALGPLKDPGAGKNERFPPEQTRALLSLSFPLTEERLSEQQILTLAKALSQAVKKNNLPVRRIDWTTLRGSATLADMDKVTEITDSGLRWKHAYLAVSTALGWKNLSMANRHSGLPTSAEDSVPQAINDMVAQTLGDSHTQEPLPIGLTTSSPLPAPKSRKRKQREQKSASNFVRKLRRLHDLKQIEARRE